MIICYAHVSIAANRERVIDLDVGYGRTLDLEVLGRLTDRQLGFLFSRSGLLVIIRSTYIYILYIYVLLIITNNKNSSSSSSSSRTTSVLVLV